MNGGDVDASDPHRWLEDAEEDLRAAELFQQRTDFAPRHACWYALQSAEKALKGLTLWERDSVRRTHELVDIASEAVDIPVTEEDLDQLTDYGLGGRYPDADPTPTAEDARRAVAIAGTIYDLVAAEFQRRSASG